MCLSLMRSEATISPSPFCMERNDSVYYTASTFVVVHSYPLCVLRLAAPGVVKWVAWHPRAEYLLKRPSAWSRRPDLNWFKHRSSQIMHIWAVAYLSSPEVQRRTATANLSLTPHLLLVNTVTPTDTAISSRYTRIALRFTALRSAAYESTQQGRIPTRGAVDPTDARSRVAPSADLA